MKERARTDTSGAFRHLKGTKTLIAELKDIRREGRDIIFVNEEGKLVGSVCQRDKARTA